MGWYFWIFKGSPVPRSYDSYWLDVPVDAVMRCVRFYFDGVDTPGSSMQHTDPRGLS